MISRLWTEEMAIHLSLVSEALALMIKFLLYLPPETRRRLIYSNVTSFPKSPDQFIFVIYVQMFP